MFTSRARCIVTYMTVPHDCSLGISKLISKTEWLIFQHPLNPQICFSSVPSILCSHQKPGSHPQHLTLNYHTKCRFVNFIFKFISLLSLSLHCLHNQSKMLSSLMWNISTTALSLVFPFPLPSSFSPFPTQRLDQIKSFARNLHSPHYI